MSGDKQEKARKLLDAQVAFMTDQLTGKAFKPIVREEVDHFYEVGRTLKVGDLVKPEKIARTARKYAVELPMTEGIDDLLHAIADHIYNHPRNEKNTFEDLLQEDDIRETLRTLLEMTELRQRIISEVAGNKLTVNLISDMLYRGIRGFVMEGTNMANAIPGASSFMKLGKSVMNRAAPSLEKNVETSIKKYISHNTRQIIKATEKRLEKSIENGDFEKAVMGFWDEIRDEQVSSLKRYVGQEELEDTMHAGLHVWKHVRETGYFSAIVDGVIEFFFERYGPRDLTSLIEELGITPEMMVDDAMNYAPDVLKMLKKKGILQDTLRRRLAPFYEAESTLALL